MAAVRRRARRDIEGDGMDMIMEDVRAWELSVMGGREHRSTDGIKAIVWSGTKDKGKGRRKAGKMPVYM